MPPAETFELVLGMLGAALLLTWIADRLRWPPSAALLVGGGALAFVPGVPHVALDPNLVLVLFLPPLLGDGAWFAELSRFRRHLPGILSLAIGAVIFSTVVVAWIAHHFVPSLPWAACAALGAIVSPPDAVSARAVLQRVRLPRRLSALLEGESLLNDATGLVIFRFAVAAAMGAQFDAGAALGRFVILIVGGIAVGLAIGLLWVAIVRRLHDEVLIITVTFLSSWVGYVAGEALGVSGVIAVVTGGLVLGWHQHVVFSAATRLRGTSFWQVLIFLLEASVFILIGFSLRDVLDRTGGIEAVLGRYALPLLAIILALTCARFAWVFASDAAITVLRRVRATREPRLGIACATVMGWAGMRGVVTLAAALTLPDTFPGRDFILLAAFGVILVTVILQGSTLGILIRLLGVRRAVDDEPPLGLLAAEQAMMKAQLAAVEQLAQDEHGNIVHPQLLRRYTARATVSETFAGTPDERVAAIASHFDVVIGAVRAGRAELVRLHRAHRIDDETLRSLELDLDLEELGAISAKGLTPLSRDRNDAGEATPPSKGERRLCPRSGGSSLGAMRPLSIALLGATTLLATPALADTRTPPPVTPMTVDIAPPYDEVRPDADYVKRVVMVPMRDGVKLYTVVLMRKGTTNGPILLSRTPYDAKGSTARANSQKLVDILPVMDKEFVEDGYIRVYQDIRGLHHSEGQFVMTRPIRGPLNPTRVDESTDAYDTIDWLVKHVPETNGKVGVVGSSYLGFTTLMAEIDPHPALKAAVPESPMVDTWIGDDDFHNGAFRVGSLDYFLEQSTGKAETGAKIPRGPGDDYSAYLNAGSIGDFARKWGIDQLPSTRKVMENPAYTGFWSEQAVDKGLAARPLSVPTMLVVGQRDQEDSYGAPAVYRALEPKDTANDKVSLVIGPWRHSGVNHYGYALGALTFAGDTARQFRVGYMKPFFDHWLKDAPDPHTPPVLTYATGADKWEVSRTWPAGTPTPLYLDAGFRAGFAMPGTDGQDAYVADPAKPVPFLPRPISLGDQDQWHSWLVHDQRFVDGRPDVLTYRTAPLDKAVHIMGAPQVDLFAATSGTDSDWVVKLIDVYPDEAPEAASQGSKPSMAGYELPIGIDIFRGRYVHGFATPAALTPGKPEEYRFALPNVDHVFLPGHRIMVQVQSSLFPLYDRNPQSYVDNIFNAPPASYRVATQTVYRGGGHASAVLLPIANDATQVGSSPRP